MCLSKDFVNANMNSHFENKLISEFNDRMPDPFKNKWQTHMEMDYSFYLACAGIEARQPQIHVDNSLRVSIGMNKFYPLNIDGFCTDHS